MKKFSIRRMPEAVVAGLPSIPAQDFKSIFEAAPGLYLILKPDFTIVAVSDAYLEATMTKRELILGRRLFDVFPDIPGDNEATGVFSLRDSLDHVLKYGVAHSTVVQKYDPRNRNSISQERYWNQSNTPVFNTQKELTYIIHRVEEIADHQKKEEIERITTELKLRVEKRSLDLQKSLKEIEDYKYALDESSIVAITDQKGVINYVNDNFCKISKYSREELIGQDHRIINSGHHPKEFIKNLWVTIANGKIWKGELKNKAKDGTIYWVDTTIVPFLDEKGKPYQYVAIRADITERKRVEENLEKSLKETSDYKYALEESSIVAITDQKGIIKYANDNFCKISKYSREELIGQDHRIINSGFHPKEFIRNLWVTIANGKIWKGELKNKAKDGTDYWVDTTIVPFLNEEGKPYQYVAIRSDITERKKLEERQALFASIVNSSDDAILSRSLDGIIITWNHGAEKVFGYSSKEIIGKHISILMAPHLQHEENEIMGKIRKGEGIDHYETTRIRKDGKIIDVSLTISPMRDSLGNIIGASKISRDITERKKAEEEIKALNEDLEKRIIERTAQLRKSNEELEAFSYSVSHDLRAPLRGIIGFANILEEDYGSKLDNEAKRITAVVKDSASKMGQLIDDLLAFSRMGKQEITKTEVNTERLVNEVIDELMRQSQRPNNINWDIKPLPPVKADMNTIRQVWINLISNAIKYSGNKENQRIEIGVYNKKGQTVFFIKDNGVGFDEGYKYKLFKVFQRLHDADEFEGTGIGLALVEKIVSKHGGKVWAEGKEDEGACFYFSLPE